MPAPDAGAASGAPTTPPQLEPAAAWPPGRSARLAAVVRPHAPAIAAAAAGVAWLLCHVDAAVLDPTNVAWLMRGDWAAGYLGWAFHRLAPLGLPLGANPVYPFPIGSTLAFTDSIPLLGALLRPASALLPETFQYVGPWLLLCFALQGFVGAKLVALAARAPVARALGGALFALAPPLLHRVVGPNTGHASLAAHWLVLAFLWLALAPLARGPARRVGAAALLLVVAAGTHPYLLAMGLALALALVLRLRLVDRALRTTPALGAGAGLVAAAAGGLAAFGYLSGGVSTAAGGFGFYSADLLALASPMGWSRLWSGPRLGHGQYEGFAYLGAGVLLAGAGAAVAAAARFRALAASRWRAAWPALAAVAVLALLALSDRITAAGEPIAELELWAAIPGVASTFRSSGRFVWPLHYLAVLGAVAAIAVALRDRPRALAAALGAALAVQLADVRPPVPFDGRAGRWHPASSEAWSVARGAYRHVALYPPFLLAAGAPVAPEACGGMAYGIDEHLPAADLAYRLGATYNSAYAARLDAAAAAAACRDLRRSVLAGRLDPATLYVVQPGVRGAFDAAGATCGVLDGLVACVAGSRRDPFSEALRRSAVP
ncbi:MAG TPA: DUF6311 domain-containing protein [Anaeromyxobacter sp.]|nr:DUF6311 domain-containing protein [Anaeromyxobacter sp.]